MQRRLKVGENQTNPPRHDLSWPARQMELAAPHIHPHVGDTRHQVGVPRKAETGDVKQRCRMLVRHLHVHVSEFNDVPKVFLSSIVRRTHHKPPWIEISNYARKLWWLNRKRDATRCFLPNSLESMASGTQPISLRRCRKSL